MCVYILIHTCVNLGLSTIGTELSGFGSLRVDLLIPLFERRVYGPFVGESYNKKDHGMFLLLGLLIYGHPQKRMVFVRVWCCSYVFPGE